MRLGGDSQTPKWNMRTTENLLKMSNLKEYPPTPCADTLTPPAQHRNTTPFQTQHNTLSTALEGTMTTRMAEEAELSDPPPHCEPT